MSWNTLFSKHITISGKRFFNKISFWQRKELGSNLNTTIHENFYPISWYIQLINHNFMATRSKGCRSPSNHRQMEALIFDLPQIQKCQIFPHQNFVHFHRYPTRWLYHEGDIVSIIHEWHWLIFLTLNLKHHLWIFRRWSTFLLNCSLCSEYKLAVIKVSLLSLDTRKKLMRQMCTSATFVKSQQFSLFDLQYVLEMGEISLI